MHDVEVSLIDLLESIRNALLLDQVRGSPAERTEIFDALTAIGFPELVPAIEDQSPKVVLDEERLLLLHARLRQHQRTSWARNNRASRRS